MDCHLRYIERQRGCFIEQCLAFPGRSSRYREHLLALTVAVQGPIRPVVAYLPASPTALTPMSLARLVRILVGQRAVKNGARRLGPLGLPALSRHRGDDNGKRTHAATACWTMITSTVMPRTLTTGNIPPRRVRIAIPRIVG